MLVISRKKRQTIKIGEAVVHVHETRCGKVVLGIEAPENIKILRGEVKDAPPPRNRGEAA